MKTLRAVRIREPGGVEVLDLGEVSLRDPGPGEVRVRVAAAGLNPDDVNSALLTFVQTDVATPATAARMLVLRALLAEPCFSELRYDPSHACYLAFLPTYPAWEQCGAGGFIANPTYRPAHARASLYGIALSIALSSR